MNGEPGSRRRSQVYFVYGGYVGLLFMLTHWPNLKLPDVVERPDLYAHLGCFGTLSALTIACAFFGPALSGRNVGWSAVVALLYAAFDEALQAIPFIHRTAALDDYAANATGIIGVAIIAWMIGLVRGGVA